MALLLTGFLAMLALAAGSALVVLAAALAAPQSTLLFWLAAAHAIAPIVLVAGLKLKELVVSITVPPEKSDAPPT